MNLQVLPLRVLVSRQVIRERMDYKEHLTGKTRSELDILDRLAGRFVVQTSELVVERFFGGEKLSAEEWESKRSEMSGTLINFLDGTAEISITETSSCKSGTRKWVISDVDNVRKRFLLKSRGRMMGPDHYVYYDDYIEDGKLVTAQKMVLRTRSNVDDWDFVLDYQDSFSIDKQGNLVREFICSLPINDVKITKVMLALRVV